MDLRTREGRREQGELIKAAATAAGLTLKELASRLGVSHALIYQYVSGANLAQPDKLQEIAHTTGVSISYFFGESGADQPSATGAPSPPPAAEAAVSAPAPAGVPAAGIDSTRFQQTLRQLDQLARAQDLAGRDLPGLVSTLEQMLGLARLAGDQQLQASLLLRIGDAHADAGDLKSGADALSEGLALCRELGYSGWALSAIQSLARCRSLMGQTTEAEALFREVAESTDPDMAWRGRLGLGQILEQRDQYEEALAEYERAREAVERLPAQPASSQGVAEIYVRTNLANLYMAEGDFGTALPLWQENLDRCEEFSQTDQFLESLLSESVCHLHLGRAGMAYDLARRGVRLCRLLGDRERLAVGRACLAEVLAMAGLWTEGKDEAREAARIAADSGTTRGASYANLALARNLMLSGQFEHAQFCLDAETSSPARKIQVAAWILRSELWRRQEQAGPAEEDARRALAQVQDLGTLHLEKAAWTALAQAAVMGGDMAAAGAAMERAAALDRFTPGLAETPWALQTVRARHARAAGDPAAAAESLDGAVRMIQALRTDLAAHGVLEACLDDPEKLAVYREAVQTARSAGRQDLADEILARADWPPLNDQVE